jgi:sulfonate transport system permease protein
VAQRPAIGLAPLGSSTVRVLTEVAVPAIAVTLWLVLSADSTSPFFPPLSHILTSLKDQWFFAKFESDAVPSLINLGVAFALACVVGVLLGVFLGLAPIISDSVDPILEFLRAIPGVALVPVALLLLGIGPGMKISVIVYGAFWPILLNTVDGVRALDPVVADVTRSYHISGFSKLRRVVLPAALPQIVAGMRTSLSIAITIVVFSEMAGSTKGIGYQLIKAQGTFAIPDMWADMLLLGLLGYLLNVAFRGFERIVLRWHRGMRLGRAK